MRFTVASQTTVR